MFFTYLYAWVKVTNVSWKKTISVTFKNIEIFTVSKFAAMFMKCLLHVIYTEVLCDLEVLFVRKKAYSENKIYFCGLTRWGTNVK